MKAIKSLALFLLLTLARTEEIEFLDANDQPIMEKIQGLSNGVLCILNGVKSVLDAFKSSRSTTIKRIYEGTGFSTFVGKTTILVSKGVASKDLDKYLKSFRVLSKIPDKYQNDLNSFVENIAFVDGDAWASYDFLFNAKNSKEDESSYASFLGTLNPKSDKYDFISIANQVKFKLAPNIFIMEDSLSVAGGIYSHQKERIVEQPRNVTKEEITLIMQFFQAISFRALGQFFGLQMPALD